jgi:hydrogenase maturation protease
VNGSILIAGIGNIFNRDDAFGVSVASRLAAMQLPENVRVVDFGIRGFDLILALLEGFDLTIFVDAVSRGSLPGTLYMIEHNVAATQANSAATCFDNAHGLDPLKVLETARGLGALPRRVVVIGCEPESLGDDTGRIGLSDSVEEAVPEAIRMIRSFIANFNEGHTVAVTEIKAAAEVTV